MSKRARDGAACFVPVTGHRRGPGEGILRIDFVAAHGDLTARDRQRIVGAESMISVIYGQETIVDVIGVADPFDCEDDLARCVRRPIIPQRLFSIGLVA